MNFKQRLPMMLTLSRMLLAIPVAFFMSSEHWETRMIAAILFMIASATDYWDGYFARKWNAITNWGKFMDPIADKILVTSILVMLIPGGKLSPWLVILLVGRDLLIGGIRSVAAADQIIISANPSGKWKTALQMMAIPALILGGGAGGPLDSKIIVAGEYLLWISTILSLTSAAQYMWAYESARYRK